MTITTETKAADLTITFNGEPLTLSGAPPEVGESAPAFEVNRTPVDTISLASPLERPLLLTTAPSVDTGICAAQLKAFDALIQSASDKVPFDLWFVTRDLPFALDRFRDANDIKHVETLSDFKTHSLGSAFELVIEELGLLARTVFVIGTDGKIVYREIITEVTHEPDYQSGFDAASRLSG